MEIAGYDIDVGKVIADAVMKSSDYPFRSMLDVNNLHAKFAGLVWDLLMAELVSKMPASGNANAEQAVCALMKAGVAKDRISYHGGRFKVALTNRRYKIQRSTECFRAAPAGAERMIPVKGMPADGFADFMLRFDSLTQEIDAAAREVEAEVRKEQMRQRQEELAAQMAVQSVQSLIDEYVTPLGLDADFDVHEGVVSINLTLRKEASFTLPLDELAKKLRDPEGVMAALEVVHEDGLEDREADWLSALHPGRIGKFITI